MAEKIMSDQTVNIPFGFYENIHGVKKNLLHVIFGEENVIDGNKQDRATAATGICVHVFLHHIFHQHLKK